MAHKSTESQGTDRTESGVQGPHKRTNADIWKWKQEFDAQPRIYWTEVTFHDGHGIRTEPTGNFYESKEAALVEVRWKKERRERVDVRSAPIHSLKLAQGRWRS